MKGSSDGITNLASRNAARMILMDLENELRAMDQARFTTDGIYFDSIEGQGWMIRVFQELLDELQVLGFPEQTQGAYKGGRCSVVSNKRQFGSNGRYNGCVERRRIPEKNTKYVFPLSPR